MNNGVEKSKEKLDIVRRFNLINVVRLSGAIEKFHNMTSGEARGFIVDRLAINQIQTYDLSMGRLPELIDLEHGLHLLCDWSCSPEIDIDNLKPWQLAPNEIAIKKTDAEECLLIPHEAFEEISTQELTLSIKSVIPVYSIPEAAALLLGVPPNDLSKGAKNNLNPKSEFLQEAIFKIRTWINDGDLPSCISDGSKPKDWTFISIQDTYIRSDDLRYFIKDQLFNKLPEFIRAETDHNNFLTVDMNTHLALQAERDLLIAKVELMEKTALASCKGNDDLLTENESVINSNQQTYTSNALLLLNKASEKFWSNADPDQKDTHPKSETVINWLIGESFSNINARQGATIIRPSWAAKGKY